MSFNLETFLTLATLLTGAVVLFHALRRRPSRERLPKLVELSRAFFPVFLLVLVFRTALFEPFRIPSGSMLPTLEVGDFIVVNKFSYSLRLPVLHYSVWDIDEPRRGDVVVFRFPSKPSDNYIKRLVGLPGDRIAYRNGDFSVNGERIESRALGREPARVPDLGQDGRPLPPGWTYARENLHGVEHLTIRRERAGESPFNGHWEVPPDHYFVMGDNRENSNDSRIWGFVPRDNLVGRATLVWLNWDWNSAAADFSRIGRRIY